jgi:hypothetical protein
MVDGKEENFFFFSSYLKLHLVLQSSLSSFVSFVPLASSLYLHSLTLFVCCGAYVSWCSNNVSLCIHYFCSLDIVEIK